jgi:acyl-CoA thioesterase
VRENNERGQATAWARLRYPLIASETISPIQHLIAIADYANGLSWRFDIRSWQFVPPELTLHILRPPIGEWICLDAVTDLQSRGVGLTTARLFDQHGQVARSAQSLFIARRA